MRHFLLTLVCGLAFAIPCGAGFINAPCPKCGCCELKRVCRVVADVKKVTEAKYEVIEEEVCLLGKSCSEERVVADPCSPGGQRCETVQSPRCGRVVCKKKLKKTTTTVEKPIAKCVVDTVCCQCGNCCQSGNCGQ